MHSRRDPDDVLRDTERLQVALATTGMAVWEWEADTGKVRWLMVSEGSADVRPVHLTLEQIYARIFPDDREAFKRAVEGCIKGTAKEFNSFHRQINRDGAVVWIHANGRRFVDEDGKLLRITGSAVDMTHLIAAQDIMRESHERAHLAETYLRMIMRSAPLMIWAMDGMGICIMVEGAAMADVPAEFRACVGESMMKYVGHIPDAYTLLQRALSGETLTVESKLAGRHLETHLSPLVDDMNATTGVVGVVVDVTARWESERLATSERDAKAVALARSQFLSTMSHEIRTPMNGVLGTVDLLMDTPLTPEQQQYVQTLQKCGKSLLTILNDILDQSKLESGRMDLQLVSFDLSELLEQESRLLRQRCEEKDIALQLVVDPDIPRRLLGDPTRVGQILLNLMTNAIKFTSQGYVHVEAKLVSKSAAGSMVCLSVRDTGIGMSSSSVERLFLPFSQVHSNHKKNYGGTGLGLTIAKRLVELMHGELTVESQEGVGSTFSCTINFGNSDVVPEVEEPRKPSVVLTGRKILVAEDSDVNQLIIETMLKRTGATPVVVADGQKVLDILEREDFDMVFMDCQMPVLDGFMATQKLRDRERTQDPEAHIPIIALTADALAESEIRCREAGMDGFLTKPVMRKELESVLATWLLPKKG